MSEKFHCRMYENELPKVDDVVMVNVRQIADMGAYVKLVSWSQNTCTIHFYNRLGRTFSSLHPIIINE